MWDERYSNQTYAYGIKPNDFLVEMANSLPKGKVLCLAEGEGRNAVWLAQQGFEVTAVDASIVGLNKAEKLAELKKVSITTIQSDLKDFDMGINQWDAIVSIFCHLPPKLRQSVHQNCVKGLKPGGVILIEAYTPSQLKYKTGGPPNAEMMMDSRVLKEELKGLEFMYLQEKVREIHEGEFHYGEGAVVQAVARKP